MTLTPAERKPNFSLILFLLTVTLLAWWTLTLVAIRPMNRPGRRMWSAYPSRGTRYPAVSTTLPWCQKMMSIHGGQLMAAGRMVAMVIGLPPQTKWLKVPAGNSQAHCQAWHLTEAMKAIASMPPLGALEMLQKKFTISSQGALYQGETSFGRGW